MFLNWKNKPNLHNLKEFTNDNLIKKLNVYSHEVNLNLLIKSENNAAVSSLINSKAFEKINNFGGIKLIYVDPPYFTEKMHNMKGKKNAIAYEDIYGHSIEDYINKMYIQLKLLYELLDESGSIYVHVDYRTSSYLRIILDINLICIS